MTGRIDFFHIGYIHYLAAFVKVVYIGIDTEHLPVIKTHQEALTAPKFSSARIGRKFCHPCADILTLEMHIHHITLVVHVLSGEFRLLAGFVVNLDTAHDIGGQVIERGLNIPLKKVLAANQQIVYPLAVDAYLAVCHFCSRQLLNKFTERFCLRHIKGICIVNKSIPFVKHLDTGGIHHHFIEFPFRGTRYKIDGGYLNKRTSGLRFYNTRIILKPLGAYEKHEFFLYRNYERKCGTFVLVCINVGPVVALFGNQAVTGGICCPYSRTVGCHQTDNGTTHSFLCQ